MKVIISGANGFIGSALVKKCLDEDVDILAIDRSFSDNRVPLDNRIVRMKVSIENIEEIKQFVNNGDYEVFYHFAWSGSSGNQRMDENIQIGNALNTVKCLRLAKEIGCKKFICAGSIMEFEVHEVVYSQESTPGLPFIYGVGKVLAHELCKPIANNIGIDLIWAYITNAYGVGEKSPRLINSTLLKLIRNDSADFTAGTQNYDFVYIDDVATAFFLLGKKAKANKGYVIGSGHPKPLKDFIIEMYNVVCPNRRPIFGNIPFSGVNLSLYTFDTKEINEDCGFSPSVSFAEGIKRTYQWLKEQEINEV